MQTPKEFIQHRKERLTSEDLMYQATEEEEITMVQQRWLREIVHDLGAFLKQSEFREICNTFAKVCDRFLVEVENDTEVT